MSSSDMVSVDLHLLETHHLAPMPISAVPHPTSVSVAGNSRPKATASSNTTHGPSTMNNMYSFVTLMTLADAGRLDYTPDEFEEVNNMGFVTLMTLANEGRLPSHHVNASSCVYGDILRTPEKLKNMSSLTLLGLEDARGSHSGVNSSALTRPLFDVDSLPRTTTTNTHTAFSKNIPFQLEPVTPQKPNEGESPKEKIVGDGVIELCQMKEKTHLIIDPSSKVTSTQLQESRKPENVSTKDTVLIKTPQLKARRKKHRPKVVIDGQKKRGPESSAQKTPPQDTTGVKRKYVWRGVTSDQINQELIFPYTPTVQKTHSRRKQVNKPESDVNKETMETNDINAPPQRTRRSCRRSLNFGIDSILNGRSTLEGMLALGPMERIRKKRMKSRSLLEIYRQMPASSSSAAAIFCYEPPMCMEALVADTRRTTMSTKKRSKRNMSNHKKVANRPMGPQLLAPTWRNTSSVDSNSEKQNALLTSYQTHYYLEQHVLVPYQRNGVVVPFDRSFDQVREKRVRPKVYLDDETTKVSNFLLKNINGEGIDGSDEEETKRREEERRDLSGKVGMFIERMHLVQGDRRFSPWKGSVVDSVVGVFLTQNVSDHLSSSAFMSLAAQFPLIPKTKPAELHEENLGTEDVCCLDPYETFRLKDNILSQSVCGGGDTKTGQDFVGDSICDGLKLKDKSGGQSPDTFEHGLVMSVTNNSVSLIEDGGRAKTGGPKKDKEEQVDWDQLRKNTLIGGTERAKTANNMDSVDWDAVRCADVNEIAQTIKGRGMNNMLAERIKEFLNRLFRDHGSIDLEWLRDVPPDKAKEYLLSFTGLGLKSVECVRLLTLHHLAFPVDTNVARVVVRLGWVPLQPLPESLQLHLLERYPVMESIQKYLWPRLCKLDQPTLYELHYQLITFGKVFCTKSKPNCNACPMRGECKHFASAFASSRLCLPAPEEKSIVSATGNRAENREAANQHPMRSMSNTLQLPSPEASNSQPIIEEPLSPEPIVEIPSTPEQVYSEVSQCDIEDAFNEDPDEIPTIHINIEEFTHNLQKIMQQNSNLQEASNMSKALVALTSEAASIPVPKLKNISRLRTEHQVYELPASHPLLEGMEKQEPDDPCPYLLAIWTPGETVDSIEPPERQCSSQGLDKLCMDETCLSCNSLREANSQTVRGTILIPCRTAMRGRFPLNGTYFQVNEVFSDHESSIRPLDVPRQWLWNLPRRTVYFGTSIPTIFKGLTTEEIQRCFWRGFVCVRGFDRTTRGPRPLIAKLHFPASRLAKGKGKMDEN